MTWCVRITLRTLDTGKVNNGNNCAVCHTTKLKVGDHSVFSVRHGQPAERTFQYNKGASYPIWLQELSRSLPATNTIPAASLPNRGKASSPPPVGSWRRRAAPGLVLLRQR